MANWRWILDDDAADVSAGSGELFNKRMLQAADNAGNILITVPFGTIKDAFFYSDAGQPGYGTWPVGTWSFALDVIQANVRITAEIFVNRVAADGTVIENYGPGTTPQILGLVQTYNFNGTTVAQVAAPLPDETHRVRLGIKLTHDGSPGSEDVRIGFGNPAKYLQVPIEALPQPHRPTGTDVAVVPGASMAGIAGSGTAAPVTGSVVMAGIAPDGSSLALAGTASLTGAGASATAADADPKAFPAAAVPTAEITPVLPSASMQALVPAGTAVAIEPSGEVV